MSVTVPPAPGGGAWSPSVVAGAADEGDPVAPPQAPLPRPVPPTRLPVLALRDAVPVPTVTTSLMVGRPASLAAV